ncbi:MAG TPA: site-specific integrase [Alphaproteobacteria bacterium]|nr:site-specific integrase [Alphaproteobacteria bacterium]
MPKITKRFVESITPQPGKTLQHWDSELKGFGVLVLPSGRRTYFVQYVNANRIKKHLKIGVHGQINTEEARVLAKQHLGGIAHGEDPAAQKKENKELPLIKDLAHDYLERHAQSKKRPKSYKEDKRMIEKIIVPSLGNQQVKHISRRTIESLHLQLEKTSIQGNRVLALLSKMFNLAIKWGWRSDHPVHGIPRYHEEKRDRWLRDEELSRFWEAVECYPTRPPALALKILIYTGARKNEVLKATWNQFDLGKGVWTKPPRSTKEKKHHHLPLSEQTVTALRALQDLNTKNSSYLFPNKTGDKPLEDIKRFWEKIKKEANLEDICIHDLRHTYASHLVSGGLSLSIVGKLLGHTQASTTQRYAHLADEPLREATALFGNKMDQIMAKKV